MTFSQFWKLLSPRSRCWQVWCLLKPLSLACRWSSPCCVLTWPSLSACASLAPVSLLYKGTSHTKLGGSGSRSVVSRLCNPTDGSPPGSSVHGVLQTRILEWVAISFSKRSSVLTTSFNFNYLLKAVTLSVRTAAHEFWRGHNSVRINK